MITRYLPYKLTLRAPVTLPSAGGDPNSSTSLTYIPGSTIRGAVARALGDPVDDLSQHQFNYLILDGMVRYLNAYPRARERRAVPAPISWMMHKLDNTTGSPTRVTDLSALGDMPADNLIRIPNCCVTLGAAEPRYIRPNTTIRMHQQRDRSRGHAWKEADAGQTAGIPHGAIYTIEYLLAGQEFEGMIQIRAVDADSIDKLEGQVKQALDSPILLGRSKRGGYGGDAEIEWMARREREMDGVGRITADIEPGVEFRLLLTSAYIGRDQETGQVDPAYLQRELKDALSNRAEVLSSFYNFGVTGGFNRKWRLELPQCLTCQAGSVLIMRALSGIPVSDLVAVEDIGLGERRAEGFGRVAFLDPSTGTITIRSAPAVPRPQLNGAPPEIVQFAQRRVLEQAIMRRVAETAASLARDASHSPSSSLIGRLRNVLRAEPGAALNTLSKWLSGDDRIGLKRPAAEQLRDCRIGGTRLFEWLKQMTAENDRWRELLRTSELAQRYYIESEQSAAAVISEGSNWIRARLIDCTLATLVRKSRSRGQS